ncbi:MAG: PorP/SprF family type IX secretion system membrane protein [Bacteroidales bacterium]
MKKIIVILLFLMPALVFGQQFPFLEGYSVNPFSLSPAFAGIHNAKFLFIDYRSDWTGLDGGPRTYQLSYNDKIGKVGFGGRFIYDKTDIFQQTLLLGTYTYEVNIAREHFINFALSMGFFRNSIDLAKYFNDPTYVLDQALIYGQQQSKIKFATDISALYRYKKAEAGVLFSNVMFGTVKYANSDMTYKPLKNFLLHASYLFKIDSKWDVDPIFILRGGQHVPMLFEISPTVTWNKRFWGNLLLRTGGIFGAGLGGEVYNGIVINYSYNFSTNVALNTFGSHQVTLGVRILKPQKKSKKIEDI